VIQNDHPSFCHILLVWTAIGPFIFGDLKLFYVPIHMGIRRGLQSFASLTCKINPSETNRIQLYPFEEKPICHGDLTNLCRAM